MKKKFQVLRKVTISVTQEIEVDDDLPRLAAQKSQEFDIEEHVSFCYLSPVTTNIQYDEGAREEIEVAPIKEDGTVDYDNAVYFIDHMSADTVRLPENQGDLIRVSSSTIPSPFPEDWDEESDTGKFWADVPGQLEKK